MTDAGSTGATTARGPWQAVSGWLRDVPASDPVDRRNAPMLQVILLMLALLPPAMWLYRAVAVPVPWRPGEHVAVMVSLALSVLAAFNVWLIRRGHVQWPVRMLLVGVSVAMLLSYLSSGFESNRFEQAIQTVWLVVAGLMVGRRALWLMYGWTVLVFAVGTVVDVRSGKLPDPAQVLAVDTLIAALVFLFVAVVVDRSVTALRESLRAATERGDALVATNARLTAEIVERERVQSQLVHAQKVEAVGRLAGGVAHDFNHLLALILGYAGRGRQADDPAAMREALDGVELAARRATAVSRKLLSFARHDPPQAKDFDAGAAVRAVEPMLRQLFDPSVRIRMDVAEGAWPVHMDPMQLDLVLLSIAANANHAMPDGGEFHIALRGEDDHRVRLEFGDTGAGMDAEVASRVFEPFFTTKPAGEGTGLGMAVARDLVQAAGGTLVLETAPGAGTRFSLVLPLLPAVA